MQRWNVATGQLTGPSLTKLLALIQPFCEGTTDVCLRRFELYMPRYSRVLVDSQKSQMLKFIVMQNTLGKYQK